MAIFAPAFTASAMRTFSAADVTQRIQTKILVFQLCERCVYIPETLSSLSARFDGHLGWLSRRFRLRIVGRHWWVRRRRRGLAKGCPSHRRRESVGARR